MAEIELPNENGENKTMEATIPVLNQRVSTVEAALTNISAQISNLASKIEERSKTQWPLWIGFGSIILAMMTYLDSAKISPLKERDTEIIAMIKEIVTDNKTNVVPQWVHQREWGYRDSQFKAQEERAKIVETNQSERIARMEKMFGDTWNLRDGFTSLQQRIDRIERDTWHASVEKPPRS